MPKAELDEFIYNRIKPFDFPFSQLDKTGTGWFYRGVYYTGQAFGMGGNDRRMVNLGFDNAMVAQSEIFIRCDNVHWDGDILDGKLNGYGNGFAHITGDGESSQKYNGNGWQFSGESWVYFTALFDMGFPVGEVTIHWFDPTKNRFYYAESYFEPKPSEFRDLTFTLGPFVNGTAIATGNGIMTLIEPDGYGKPTPEMQKIIAAQNWNAIKERGDKKRLENETTVSYYLRGALITYRFNEPHTKTDRQEISRILRENNIFYTKRLEADNTVSVTRFYLGELSDETLSGRSEGFLSRKDGGWSIVQDAFNTLGKYPAILQQPELKDRFYKVCKRLGQMKAYYDVYHDYGSLSPEEILAWEKEFIMNHTLDELDKQYPVYFPTRHRQSIEYQRSVYLIGTWLFFESKRKCKCLIIITLPF